MTMFVAFLVAANPAKLEGVISGAMCGIHSMKCDHKVGAHGYETLGLFVDGKGFFFFANVPQKVLKKYNRKEVVVVGKLYEEHRAIVAQVIKVNGKVVWNRGKKKGKEDTHEKEED